MTPKFNLVVLTIKEPKDPDILPSDELPVSLKEQKQNQEDKEKQAL